MCHHENDAHVGFLSQSSNHCSNIVILDFPTGFGDVDTSVCSESRS